MGLPLDARLDIQELVALHGHLIDEGALGSLDRVFVPDVVYDLSALGGPVLDGIAAVVEAAVQLGDGNPIAHHVTNVIVTEQDDASVRVSSKGLAVRSDGSVGSVVYDDVVTRTSRGWRISRRAVRLRRNPLTASA